MSKTVLFQAILLSQAVQFQTIQFDKSTYFKRQNRPI